MLLKEEEIEEFLRWNSVENNTTRFDGIVDVDGGVDLRDFNGSAIPVQFGNVTGNFECPRLSLTSLKGCPQLVEGNFVCYSSSITSLEYAPQFVGGYFNCYLTKITSFHDIHKQINHISNEFYCGGDVTHLLGLLLINGINRFVIDDGGPIDKIFNKYVGTSDILSAQDELIDAGFIDQARL
jgi:hypothetical protein